MNKSTLKKLSYLLVFSLLLGAAVSFTACQADSAHETEPDTDPATDPVKESEANTEPETVAETEASAPKKSIDVYIIAGQSNGAGYTKVNASVLKTLWNDYRKGNGHVLYTGRAEFTNNVNTPNVSTGANEFKKWVNARSGQGMSSDRMGAEVGMAKTFLDKYYNETTGKTAGIIKFAHGGTSLLGQTGGENAANGNWVSPSYAALKGYDYSDESLHGGLYRDLLVQVQKSVDDLKALEYDDINLKGVFWMQGESDSWDPAEYKKSFELFASDLRRDLSEIMGEDMSELAIIVGEISRTSGAADASTVAKNETFIAMQRKLAEEISDVYTIASGQYEITTLVNGSSVNDTFQGDAWHWNTEAMFNIGVLVAECIIENVLGK